MSSTTTAFGCRAPRWCRTCPRARAASCRARRATSLPSSEAPSCCATATTKASAPVGCSAAPAEPSPRVPPLEAGLPDHQADQHDDQQVVDHAGRCLALPDLLNRRDLRRRTTGGRGSLLHLREQLVD